MVVAVEVRVVESLPSAGIVSKELVSATLWPSVGSFVLLESLPAASVLTHPLSRRR